MVDLRKIIKHNPADDLDEDKDKGEDEDEEYWRKKGALVKCF